MKERDTYLKEASFQDNYTRESQEANPNYHPNENSVSREINVNDCWNHRTHRYQVGDIIDVLDAQNTWNEAEVIKIDVNERKLFISYLYWNNSHDEWITNLESRIAPVHTFTYFEGGELKIGQRVEALDEKNKWLHAIVIDSSKDEVCVYCLLVVYVGLIVSLSVGEGAFPWLCFKVRYLDSTKCSTHPALRDIHWQRQINYKTKGKDVESPVAIIQSSQV